MRRSNLSAIVRELHVSGPLSRSDLVARTGLTRSAIRVLIGDLAAGGLVVEEAAAGSGSPGRPSPLVHLQPHSAVVLSFDVAVDSLAVAVIGVGGALLDCRRVERQARQSSATCVSTDLARMADEALDRTGTADNLVGVGVAVAGVVRRTDGFVWMAPNLCWREVAFGDLLAEALRRPVPIQIANDADLGALAELRRGVARGSDNVVFVSGDVGVGGGLVLDAAPRMGAAGYGGEVGHMPVNRDGRRCRCGSVGCWETEVGSEALLVLAGYPRDAGPDGVEEVLREAARGSATAVAAVKEVGRWLGFGLAALINVLNPSLVVLGGHFGRLLPLVESTIMAEVDRRALPASRALVRLVPGTLGLAATLVGAAELALEPLLANPAAWAARS